MYICDIVWQVNTW